jgi:hypothetical protein
MLNFAIILALFVWIIKNTFKVFAVIFLTWLLVLALCCFAQGQETHAPVERNFKTYLQSNTIKAEIAADFSMRQLDTLSTRQKLTDPCQCFHESNIPVIASTTPGMVLYGLVVTAGLTAASYELYKHHHDKLSKLPLLIDGIYDGRDVVHNFMLKPRSAK